MIPCAGAVLGWHVREGGVTPEALQRFNAERGPRVREVLTKVPFLPSTPSTSSSPDLNTASRIVVGRPGFMHG